MLAAEFMTWTEMLAYTGTPPGGGSRRDIRVLALIAIGAFLIRTRRPGMDSKSFSPER